MEYKYRMLNPVPFSTQSIDFKLSQTYLQNYTVISPTKPVDSLTYTVSMETINDQEYSPYKNVYGQHLNMLDPWHHDNCHRFERKNNQPFNLNSAQPIVSIKIQSEQQTKPNQKQSEVLPSSITQFTEQSNKIKGIFVKGPSTKLNITNLQLNKQVQQDLNQRLQKMGKVMSKIHSNIKQKKYKCKIRQITNLIQAQNLSSLEQRANKIQNSQAADKVKNKPGSNKSIMRKKCIETTSQILSSDTTKNSVLTATNTSSNSNASPQLLRRKSQYVVSTTKKRRSVQKYKNIFLTDRVNTQSKRKIHIKQRVFSTMTYHYQISETETNENLRKNSHQNVKNKYKSISKEQRIQSTANYKHILKQPLQIKAIKVNFSDRNYKNKQILRDKLCWHGQQEGGLKMGSHAVKNLRNYKQKQNIRQSIEFQKISVMNKKDWIK